MISKILVSLPENTDQILLYLVILASLELVKTYFSTAKVFDSLSYMNTQTVFQLVGEEENIFKHTRLKEINIISYNLEETKKFIETKE